MRKAKKISRLIGICVVSISTYFIGCQNAVEIDFPLLYEGDRIVILSNLLEGQEVFVQLYTTSAPLDTFILDSFYVQNADVRLFENDSVYHLMHIGSGIYKASKPLFAKSGNTYRIEASAPGFPQAYSDSEVVPPRGTISNVSWMPIEPLNQYDGILSFDVQIPSDFPFDIIITGIAGSEATSPEYDITQGIGLFCESVVLVQECLTEDGHIEIQVNKEYWNGNETLINTHLRILLIVLSPAQKAYEESTTLQEDAFDYPFISNSSPYTNIHNGYGLLSSSAENEVVIEIH